MEIVCPIDIHVEEIQKISAVVASGHSRGTFSGPTVGITRSDEGWGVTSGITTASGSMTTALARMLAPPSEPRKRAFRAVHWLGTAVLIFMGGTTALIGLIGMASGDSGLEIYLLFGGLLVGVSVWRIINNPRKQREDEVARREWLAARDRWASLYYCYRHDIAFNPETGETTDPSNLSALYDRSLEAQGKLDSG